MKIGLVGMDHLREFGVTMGRRMLPRQVAFWELLDDLDCEW